VFFFMYHSTLCSFCVHCTILLLVEFHAKYCIATTELLKKIFLYSVTAATVYCIVLSIRNLELFTSFFPLNVQIYSVLKLVPTRHS
jgi:hypothetical protein